MVSRRRFVSASPRVQHALDCRATAPVDRKKPSPPRRIWRVTAQAPNGEFVDFDPTAPDTVPGVEAPARVLDPAPVVDWRGSSWDLLNGLEVRDHSDSIPGALFEKLFKR